MDLCNAYAALGTHRGAATFGGATHKTMMRVVERPAQDQVGRHRAQQAKTTYVQPPIEEHVRQTDWRISAMRLQRVARAAGYGGLLRSPQQRSRSPRPPRNRRGGHVGCGCRRPATA